MRDTENGGQTDRHTHTHRQTNRGVYRVGGKIFAAKATGLRDPLEILLAASLTCIICVYGF